LTSSSSEKTGWLRGNSTCAAKFFHPIGIVEFRVYRLNDPAINAPGLIARILHVDDVDALGSVSLVGTYSSLPSERDDAFAAVVARACHSIDAQNRETNRWLGALTCNKGVSIWKRDRVDGSASEEVDAGRYIAEAGG
jgi:hypothetical protein